MAELTDAVNQWADGVDWAEIFNEAEEGVRCLQIPREQRPEKCFKLLKDCKEGSQVLIGSACGDVTPDDVKTSTPINPWLIAGGMYLLLLRK